MFCCNEYIVVISIMVAVNLSIDSNMNVDQNNVREAFADKNSQSKNPEIINHRMSKALWVIGLLKGR